MFQKIEVNRDLSIKLEIKKTRLTHYVDGATETVYFPVIRYDAGTTQTTCVVLSVFL